MGEGEGDSKGALRRRLREIRAEWATHERRSASGALYERLRAQAWWQRAREVAAFVGMPDELDTVPWIEAACGEGKLVWLPRVDSVARKTMVWARFEGTEALVSGPWGLREPSPEAPWRALEGVDVVLVPGLAFDRRGVRLGLGGGFYDRALAPFRELEVPLRVGVCAEQFFAPPIQLPLEPHDVRVHRVVTDVGEYDCA